MILCSEQPVTVRPHRDPLQFAYQPRLRAEDAIISLLNHVYTKLDQPASTVSVVFFNFSSSFNRKPVTPVSVQGVDVHIVRATNTSEYT